MTEVFAELPPALKSLDLQTHSGLIPIRWPPLDEAHAMQLLGLLAGCFGFAVIVFFVLLFARNRAERLFPQREESSSAPHTFALIIKRTPALSLAAAALAIAARVFGIWAPWIRAVFVAALIVQAGLWGVTFIDAMSRRFLERQGDPRSMASAISLVRVLSRTVLWSIVLLSILRTMGIDVTAMIAGLGIGGIAIGLAAQGIFADLFGSLAIVFDKPFDQGDYITFGDTAGTIEHVGVKSTRIRALTGEQVVLSNSALLQHTIRNFQRLQERRVLFSLGVTYQTPHEKVGAIPGMVRDAIARAGCTRFDRCHFKEFGDSALLFEVAYYVLTADFHTHMDTRQAINLEIMRRFAEQGIEFAYPTQTLFLERAGV